MEISWWQERSGIQLHNNGIERLLTSSNAMIDKEMSPVMHTIRYTGMYTKRYTVMYAIEYPVLFPTPRTW